MSVRGEEDFGEEERGPRRSRESLVLTALAAAGRAREGDGPQLPGETGEIAVALITGEQGGISEETKQVMRDSGLAHILSISGW